MGIVLAVVGFGIVFGAMTQYFLTINQERVPTEVRPHVIVLSVGSALSAVAVALSPTWAVILLGVFSVSVGALLLYILSIRRLPLGALTAVVGEPMPEFAAPDQDGAPFSLKSLRGQRVMVKFFRGSW